MILLTIITIILNIVIMGFLISCAIVDHGNRSDEFQKLGPKKLIYFFITVWVVGFMAGALC